MINYTVLMQ